MASYFAVIKMLFDERGISFLETISQGGALGVIGCTPDGFIFYSNKRALILTEYDSLFGKNVNDILIPPGERSQHRVKLKDFIENNSLQKKTVGNAMSDVGVTLVTSNNQSFPITLSLYARMMDAFKYGVVVISLLNRGDHPHGSIPHLSNGKPPGTPKPLTKLGWGGLALSLFQTGVQTNKGFMLLVLMIMIMAASFAIQEYTDFELEKRRMEMQNGRINPKEHSRLLYKFDHPNLI